jgi:hypothetical protein
MNDGQHDYVLDHPDGVPALVATFDAVEKRHVERVIEYELGGFKSRRRASWRYSRSSRPIRISHLYIQHSTDARQPRADEFTGSTIPGAAE